MSPKIAQLWVLGLKTLSEQPVFADHFAPNGQPPTAGQRFYNPLLAQSLRQIAETRGKSFYEGILAQKIAASSNA